MEVLFPSFGAISDLRGGKLDKSASVAPRCFPFLWQSIINRQPPPTLAAPEGLKYLLDLPRSWINNIPHFLYVLSNYQMDQSLLRNENVKLLPNCQLSTFQYLFHDGSLWMSLVWESRLSTSNSYLFHS